MRKHTKNSHASATPIWDGQRVITVFMVHDGVFVTALDRNGNRQWQTSAGPFTSEFGYGSSPVAYRSLVIVAGDNPATAFLAALDRQTGAVVWRVKRKDQANFSTPIIASLDGRDQLLVSGQGDVCSYDPADGALLWKTDGPATRTANTMSWHKNLVFASGGYPQENLLAIRVAGGGGGEIVWQQPFNGYVPSPLVIGDKLLAAQDNTIVRCFAAESGKEFWKRRLGNRGFSASPTAVGQTIYLPDETGNVFVFRVDDRFQLLAENKLDGDGMASPVICGGRIYLRSSKSLYCIGEP